MARLSPIGVEPTCPAYDVVIIGGAMIGASIAWFLSANPDFVGRVLVVERDPSYQNSSTAHTNSCMRQQFSNPINVQISQYAALYVKTFREQMGGDPQVPHIALHSFGYMYLVNNENSAAVLRENQRVQAACGAATRLLTPRQIAAEYPFYRLDDIILGSHNPVDEGYFDGNTVFDWWRRKGRQSGVEYITNEVVAMTRSGNRIDGVTLKSGGTISAGQVVNATGPRAARTAQMAGLALPVEPRKRYTFIFDAAQPLDRDLPLTIDPSGIHFRTDGRYYLVGAAPEIDDPVAFDDFALDHAVWETRVWPLVAARIPQFAALKLVNAWAGHYAYNALDQNAVLGPHDEVGNFFFANGFSGHGLQQAPAMGRGMAELLVYGGFRTLDLSPFCYDRIRRNQPFIEKAVI